MFKNSLLGFLVIFFLAGCTGIVKKPEALQIRKVAIISIFSNQDVYNVGQDQDGPLSFISIPYFTKAQPQGNSLSLPQTGSFKLVTFSLNTFEEELSKIKGWQIVPSIKVINSQTYRTFASRFKSPIDREIASQVGSIVNQWQTPEGMLPVTSVDIKDKKEALVAEINRIADDLGLDAVVLIQLDFGYSPDHATPDRKEDTADAYASVASSIKVINRHGKFAISTPDPDKSSGERFTSEGRASFIGKELIFNDEVENLFKNAIQKSAVDLRQKINKEL